LWAAQEWFRKQYLSRYRTGLDSNSGPFRFWTVGERALLFDALTHHDPDAGMERVRRATIALLVFAFVVFIAFGLSALP
jgi:hypothetical protein